MIGLHSTHNRSFAWRRSNTNLSTRSLLTGKDEIMKKIIAVISLIMILILCSCDNSSENTSSNQDIKELNTEVNGELFSDKSIWDITVSLKLEESDEAWDEKVMDAISPQPIIDLGFIHVVDNKRWLIEVKNNDNRDLRTVEIIYSITAYKHEIEFGIDKADIKRYEPVVYKQFSNKIKVDELDMEESMTEIIFYMGTFPYVEVRVDKIMVNGIEQLIQLPSESYLYHEFNELQDSQHLRLLLGI